MRRMSAFEIWLRWGRIVTKPDPIETKFNPWHDPDDGRFTFAGQGNRFGGGAPKSREANSSSCLQRWGNFNSISCAARSESTVCDKAHRRRATSHG